MALGLGINHSVTDYALGWEPMDSEPIGTATLFLKNNTNVSPGAWLDEIGNTGDFIQQTTSNQATLLEGGLNFDGVNDNYVREELLSLKGDLIIVIVFNPSENLVGEGFFDSQENSNNSQIYINLDRLYYVANGQLSSFTFSRAITADSTQYIVISKENNGQMFAYHNQHGTATTNSEENSATFNIRNIGHAGGNFFPGTINEAFIINGTIETTYKFNLIKDYLLYKFNLRAA